MSLGGAGLSDCRVQLSEGILGDAGLSPSGIGLRGQRVVVTGDTTDQSCGFRFDSQGRVFIFRNAVFTQVHQCASWFIPNTPGIGALYEIRLPSSPPDDPFTTSPVADGTFIDISVNRDWTLTASATPEFLATGKFAYEIRRILNPGDRTVGSPFEARANKIFPF